jgi:lysophospholipase L1-like esterase
MVLKNKKIIIIFVLILVVLAYLIAANANIYRIIHKAGLSLPDKQSEYFISKFSNKNILIYSALGDSLTSGVGADTFKESYPYEFANKISDQGSNVKLLARSYPGARTQDALENLLPGVISDNPDLVTVLLGVNDIHNRTSEKEFTENYTTIVNQLKTKTHAKIYLIAIPFLGTPGLLLPPYNYYFKNQTIKFNSIIKNLASQNGLVYIDLFTPTEDFFSQPGLYSKDLFHPSASAYKLWSEIIYANYNK